MGWSKRLLFVFLVFVALPAYAQDDPRAQAHDRYRAGEMKFRAADYRGAIEEFRAADRLMPAPMNSYNIGLAHERLGENDKATQAYREYLMRRPDAPNKADIEARITALENGPPAATPEPAPTQATGTPPARRDYDSRFATRIPAPGAQPQQAQPPQQQPYPPPEQQPEPKRQKAFYKHWAFWVVVGVGAIILIDIARGNSSDDTPAAGAPNMGAVILRF